MLVKRRCVYTSENKLTMPLMHIVQYVSEAWKNKLNLLLKQKMTLGYFYQNLHKSLEA